MQVTGYDSNVASDTQVPDLFKGIALFTPGGDLIYCIDPHKQSRWHLQLCIVLQEMLNLSEPPHFLVPCYTATVDRWRDPQTQQTHTAAEAYPFVMRHQALLNAIFGIGNLPWQAIAPPDGLCDPLILSTYRHLFPQLWQDHDLVMRLDGAGLDTDSTYGLLQEQQTSAELLPTSEKTAQGYVLRLYVSGHTAATEQILQNLHHLLNTSMQTPYTLKIIDIYKNPEQAEMDQVTATPTLVRAWPHPVRRIVGNLDDMRKVLQVLGAIESL